MQFSSPSLSILGWSTGVFRLLTVVLAALAVTLSGQPADLRLVLLGVGYAAAAGVLWLLAPRLLWAWLIYPSALVDVGVVTALLSLSPSTPLPLWVLFLFPIASAAAAGRTSAAVTAVLSVIGYLGATVLTSGTVPALAFWPAVMLAAAAFVVSILATRWLTEQQEKRAWQQVAAGTRALGGSGEAEDVATRVAERARRLVQAEGAWLWRWTEPDQLHLVHDQETAWISLGRGRPLCLPLP